MLFGRSLALALLGISATIGSVDAFSQQLKDDLAAIIRSHAPADQASKSSRAARPSTAQRTELGATALGLIRLYQLLISSQDGQVCNFTVSCSRFATVAIQRYGLGHGIAMASDRIQRCNGIGRGQYPADPQSGLAIDLPVASYYAGRLNGSQ